MILIGIIVLAVLVAIALIITIADEDYRSGRIRIQFLEDQNEDLLSGQKDNFVSRRLQGDITED